MQTVSRKQSPIGVQVAKLIIAGDVDTARKIASHTYTVAESRAIVGACREANRRWNCKLDLASFIK